MDNRVTNNTLSPIVLDSGTTMAASGTPGSVRENVSLSEGDRRRYVQSGLLTVTKVSEEEVDKKVALPKEAGGTPTPPVYQIADKRQEKK